MNQRISMVRHRRRFIAATLLIVFSVLVFPLIYQENIWFRWGSYPEIMIYELMPGGSEYEVSGSTHYERDTQLTSSSGDIYYNLGTLFFESRGNDVPETQHVDQNIIVVFSQKQRKGDIYYDFNISLKFRNKTKRIYYLCIVQEQTLGSAYWLTWKVTLFGRREQVYPEDS